MDKNKITSFNIDEEKEQKQSKVNQDNKTKQKSNAVSAPTIAECPIALECRVCEIVPMGSHDVFIADIVGASCHESLIDENGKMHYEKANLLAYAHGEYYALGGVVGRFGFSTDKPKKSNKTNNNDQKTPKKENKTKPFYENAPRSKSPKKPVTDKNKGAPHGKRGRAKK